MLSKKNTPIFSNSIPLTFFLLVSCIVFNTNCLVAQVETQEELSNVSLEEFRVRALQKVEDLGMHIQTITNHKASAKEVDNSMRLALRLFTSEEDLVEVSSITTKKKYLYFIKVYLNHLTLLEYDKIVIEWTNIQYVSNLRKGADGKYYGVITFEQRFSGYRDGKLIYGDITNKNITVVLDKREKYDPVQDKMGTIWEVLLSNIGVVQTEAYSGK